jgi:hypothetical protein
VFEHDTNLPLSRHYQLGWSSYGVTKGITLTIRGISSA